MDSPSFKALLERNIAVWFLGTLLTGGIFGFGLMRGLEQYTGMVLLTKREDAKRQSAIETCKQELSTKAGESTALNAQLAELARKTASFEDLAGELTQCKSAIPSRDAKSHEDLEEVARLQSTIRGLQAASDALKSRLNAALSANGGLADKISTLESTNSTLQLKVGALQDPSVAAPPIVYEPFSVAPNQLATYFAGALTVAVLSIEREFVCLRTTGMADCKPTRVGDTLPVTLNDKTYGVRVDKLQYAGASYDDNRNHDPRSRVTLTVLLLKRGP
jgi:hypothetical protein